MGISRFRSRPKATLVATFLAALSCSPAFAAESFFAVGNSLTLDCCGADAIAAFDASLGNTLVESYHIRFGSALDYIVAHPEDNVPGSARWDQTLPFQTWQFLAVEPYPSATSTLDTDVRAIGTLVDAARVADPSHTPEVLLFAAWPAIASFQPLGGFSEYWGQAVFGDGSQPTILARRYFDVLLTRLVERYGDAVRFRIAPVGDVFAALDSAIRAGNFPELASTADLYRDTNHLGDAGRYLAGLTMIMTLRRTHASDLPVPATYLQGYAGAPVTPALTAHMEQIAASVVPTDSVLAPGDLSVTADSGSASLSWTPPANARGYALYQSQPNGSEVEPNATAFLGNVAQANVTLLSPGRTYRFAVRALSPTDISTLSAPVTVTVPPAALGGLQAEPAVGSVTLSWATSDGATSYDVYSADANTFHAAVRIATGVSATRLTVQGLSSDTQHYFFVVARAGAAESAPSPSAAATSLPPVAPEGVVAAPQDAAVTVSWTASAGASSYDVYASATAGSYASAPTLGAVSGTSATLAGLSNGTRYYFAVRATTPAGHSPLSVEASAVPAQATSGGGGSLGMAEVVILLALWLARGRRGANQAILRKGSSVDVETPSVDRLG
jgi:hypothetical protein